jgi:hypothetical protein
MLRAVPIFLLSLSVRIRSTRGIMVSLSINTNTGDSGFTFEGWIHPFSSSAPRTIICSKRTPPITAMCG